jgi:2-keto-4-pentenoate hydratase/2-oxohepta-3-ene-1,7-dioic acid hydratase in catechol pathway
MRRAAILSEDGFHIIDMNLLHQTQNGQMDLDFIIENNLLEKIQDREGEITDSTEPLQETSFRYLPVIWNPEKIVMVAINYHGHLKEQHRDPPILPYFFTRMRNSLIAHNDPILKPKVSKMVDWEGELAVIIGKKCKYVEKRNYEEYIAGYTLANDVSFRDLQIKTDREGRKFTDWVPGKTLDSSFPLGPVLITKDEIGDVYSRRLTLKVNGRTEQDSLIDDMVFKIDVLMENITSGITLVPGDIISTGTPGGVAYYNRRNFLKEGDMIEVSLENLATLRNPVKEEN